MIYEPLNIQETHWRAFFTKSVAFKGSTLNFSRSEIPYDPMTYICQFAQILSGRDLIGFHTNKDKPYTEWN